MRLKGWGRDIYVKLVTVIKNNLKKLNADLAGEMSGHIFYAKDYYGFDDAFFAAVKVLEIINNNDKKLSDLVDEIPRVFNTLKLELTVMITKNSTL